MNPYCPLCETDLDPATATCPACRWQDAAVLSVARPSAARVSLVERYRGTEWDTTASMAAVRVQRGQGIPKGRAVLVMGVLAVGGIYGFIMAVMGMLP